MDLLGIFWCQDCHARDTKLTTLQGRMVCEDRLACLFVQAHESSTEEC